MTGHLMDRRQCTAMSKQSGERCKRAPIKGGTVCAMHGGKAPAVAAAAVQRQAVAKADAAIRDLWPGLAAQVPMKDPVDLLARAATALEHMADVVGDRVNELGHLGAGKDLTQLRAEVVLLDRLLDKLLKAGEGLARLGIAERHVELEQERAQMVTAAFLTALGVVSLVPADRDLVVRTFLEQLGGSSVAGEVEA